MKDLKRAAILGTIFLLLMFYVVPRLVFGGTYYYQVRATGSERLDSIMAVWYEDQALTDSVYVTYGNVDSIAMDDTKDYVVFLYWWWDGGDSAFVDAPIFSKFTGAAATISQANMDSIVSWTDSLLSEEHGPGQWESPGAGAGPYSVTFVVWDSANDATVPGAQVTPWNVEQSSKQGEGVSLTTGKVTFNLEAADHVVIAMAPYYTFPAYDTITIDSSETDTIKGYPFDPGTPSTPNTCILYGVVQTSTGALLAGIPVVLTPPTGVYDSCNNIAISPEPQRVRTNASGQWQIASLYSSCISDETKNKFTLTAYVGRDGQFVMTASVTVPDEDTYLVNLKK